MRMKKEHPDTDAPARGAPDLFDSARWYDLGINWEARLAREIPVLRDVFGSPGDRRLLDAGCGPGRHLVALCDAGYDVAGLDRSEAMLDVARARLKERSLDVRLMESCFDDIDVSDGLFGGLYCLGNSLAAAGTAERVEASIESFARSLAPGGRVFVQLLNFEKLRGEKPAVRGPRVRRDGDTEYLSSRVYAFCGSEVEVTNLTLWHDGQWRQVARSGSLYAVSVEDVERWFPAFGLRIDALYGSYALDAFDLERSGDLIVVATKCNA